MKERREDHRLYSTWKSMRSRCTNPNVQCYSRYGGRGIKVCKRWEDFWAFVDDMYPTFQEGLTLDRKDNDKGYSLENCRWATREEQMNNQDKCLTLLFEGKEYTEAELARKVKISRTTIQTRRNAGYTVEEMVYGRDTEGSGTPKKVVYDGITYGSMKELAIKYGVNVGTLRWRIRNNWTIEEAVNGRD